MERRRLWIDAGEVVDGDVVEVRQPDDQRERDFPLALLIVGVGGFVHSENPDKLILRQITVFPKIPKPRIVHERLQSEVSQ